MAFNATIQGLNPEDVVSSGNLESVQTAAPLPGLTHEEFAALAASILVVIPYRAGEGIASGICTHFGMWGRIGLRIATLKDPFGGFVEFTRASMVKLFLEVADKDPDVKYLVMIDNDEGIEWDAPLLLAQHGLPICSGVVCGYTPERGIFACFTVKDANGVARFPSWAETKKIPARGIVKVEQVGTGLVAIRRDVLETMLEAGEHPFEIPQDVRSESMAQGNIKRSEDICFCERAKRFGFYTYVDFSVHALHFKTLALSWPRNAIDDDIDAIDWKPSIFDHKGVL